MAGGGEEGKRAGGLELLRSGEKVAGTDAGLLGWHLSESFPARQLIHVIDFAFKFQNFTNSLSHRIFKYMHRVLNVAKKN